MLPAKLALVMAIRVRWFCKFISSRYDWAFEEGSSESGVLF